MRGGGVKYFEKYSQKCFPGTLQGFRLEPCIGPPWDPTGFPARTLQGYPGILQGFRPRGVGRNSLKRYAGKCGGGGVKCFEKYSQKCFPGALQGFRLEPCRATLGPYRVSGSDTAGLPWEPTGFSSQGCGAKFFEKYAGKCGGGGSKVLSRDPTRFPARTL